MTNTFIPTLSRHPLYCVCSKNGNPTRPLACVWIDPQLRSDLAHGGKWHRIRVGVTPPQNSPRLLVYAKGGYYAVAD
jgi:hypothetical protein